MLLRIANSSEIREIFELLYAKWHVNVQKQRQVKSFLKSKWETFSVPEPFVMEIKSDIRVVTRLNKEISVDTKFPVGSVIVTTKIRSQIYTIRITRRKYDEEDLSPISFELNIDYTVSGFDGPETAYKNKILYSLEELQDLVVEAVAKNNSIFQSSNDGELYIFDQRS